MSNLGTSRFRGRFRGRLWGLIALAAATATAGCVSRADFERVRKEQRTMRAHLADIQVNLDSLKKQVSTTSDDESVRQAVANVEALDRRVAAVEETMRILASGQARGGMPGSAGGGGLQSGVPRTRAAELAWAREVTRMASGELDPEYQRGLQLYREGQTEQAIQILRGFVNKNPKSDLADNAQFWLGEAYYSQRDYNRAIIELNEVLLKHPQGDQIPGALLSLATAFANSGDPIDARLILQKLISDHPDSEEAAIGREQLEALSG